MENTISQQVINAISLEFGIAQDKIELDADIMKDLNADSLDVSGLMGSIESIFKITISESDAHTINTVRELISFIEKKSQ